MISSHSKQDNDALGSECHFAARSCLDRACGRMLHFHGRLAASLYPNTAHGNNHRTSAASQQPAANPCPCCASRLQPRCQTMAVLAMRSTRLCPSPQPQRGFLLGAAPCALRVCARPRCAAARAFSRGQPDDLLQADCPVPSEQQPLQELKQLQEMFLFDWATMPVQQFAQKLATVWAGFFVSMALPVSAVTFDLHKELLQCLVAASAGSSFIVTVLVWRLYLGWQHVGDRLISATVEYEETGWYDGQVWVKTPQVLMRDRLMSNYTVKPALARLKRTLLGLGGSLAVTMLLLAVLPPPPAVSSSDYGSSSSYVSSAAASSSSSDYYTTLSKYEPWAADQEEEQQQGEDEPARFDMRGHMMMQQ